MAAPRNSAMQASSLCQEELQSQEHDTLSEASHQRFREFQYEEAAGPRDAFCKLWELCSQWLKPQTRSVEQILALLVLEQFLHILPADAETRMSTFGLETRQRLFTLIENLQQDHGRAGNKNNMRDMLLEELVPMDTLLTSTNMQAKPPAFQLMEPFEESLEIPPAEPQEMDIDEDPSRSFLDIDFHLVKEYELLEPPGEEPPEELLADYKEPEESQMVYQREMPGSSEEAQPVKPEAHTQAHPTEKPLALAQSGLCFAHWQQCNSHRGIHTGNIAREGPRGWPGSSHGSDLYGQQFICQEEDPQDHAMGDNPGPWVSHREIFSEPQENPLDDERSQCRPCKREFMYQLGLQERGQSQLGPGSNRCSVCGEFLGEQSCTPTRVVRCNEERPFKCKYCQKSYKHKSSLMRHLKVHRGKRERKRGQGSQSRAHSVDQ